MRLISHAIVAVAAIILSLNSAAAINFAVSSLPNKPETLGAADGTFYQFADFEAITFDLGFTTMGPSLLEIFTFDDIAPASAKVEVSSDNINFSLVANEVFDTNGTVQAGPIYPSAGFNINSSFRYIKLTDNADGSARDFGFDLDAIGVSPVPLPAAVYLFASCVLFLARARQTKP